MERGGFRVKRMVRPMVGSLIVTLVIATLPAQQRMGKAIADPVAGCTTSDCHPQVRQHQRLHEPVAENQCDACHVPKQGATPLQAGPRHEFKRAGDDPELCYACHDRLAGPADEPSGRHKFVHEPVKMGVCVLCHDPHGSEHPALLRVGTDRQLCTQCHRVTLDQGEHVHAPVGDGTCGACHNPHGSGHDKFLRAAPPELCLDCHDTIEDLLEDATGTHGAITTGESCIGCHNPHAGTYAGLLTKVYAKGPDVPYREENYALCLDCHDVEMVEEENDPDVTGFRNGDVNLHYRHVNRQEHGTACGVCHDPHAGGGPQHMADSTVLGQEAILNRYTPSATGGSCLTKCHATWAYDRISPVQNE